MLTVPLWRQFWSDRETYEERCGWIEYQKRTAAALDYAVSEPGGLCLVPISVNLLQINPLLVTDLAAWRQEAKEAYPADPPLVDTRSYSQWLEMHYYPYPRIIYLIYPPGELFRGRPVGHMGFRLDREPWPRCELDGILRGWPDGRGCMSQAFRMLTDMVGPGSWVVHPKPANTVAQAWYGRLGFQFVAGKTSHLYPNTCWEMEFRNPQHQTEEGHSEGLVSAL